MPNSTDDPKNDHDLDLDFIKKLLSDAPHTLDDKLELIKTSLRDKTYTINPELIAEGLMEQGEMGKVSLEQTQTDDLEIPECSEILD